MSILYRECVCGKKISRRRVLCSECREIYGASEDWPEWLKFYVSDMRREENYTSNHREIHYDTVSERIVSQPRVSLLDKHDENGCVILRFE